MLLRSLLKQSNNDENDQDHCPVYFLDGGLGTTLEDIFHKDISAPLWSASLVKFEPDTIVNAHLEFLKSGARVLSTSTYQCSFSTFSRSDYSENEAIAIMRKSVDLAADARTRFLQRQSFSDTSRPLADVKIALSLGPFGASLFPAQEFDGFYPLPYGPKGYSLDEPNTNAFGEDDAASEQHALGALEQFHYDRLRVFADHKGTWDKIDYVAFETVPLAREATAIRRAVGQLAMDLQRDGHAEMSESGDEGLMKPWWISTVWPNGRFPQESSPGGSHLAPVDVLRSLIDDPLPSNPAPLAIGINCTDVSHLSSITRQFRVHLDQSQPSQHPLSLIVYPNAGYSYDILTKSWSLPSDEELSRKEWARKVGEVVRRERASGTWKSIVVGGCCKAGPSHIAVLVEELRG